MTCLTRNGSVHVSVCVCHFSLHKAFCLWGASCGPLGGLVLITGGSYCSTSGCTANLWDTSQLRVSEGDKEIREAERGGGSIRAYLYLWTNMKTHRQWGSHHGPSKSNLIDCKSGYCTPQPCTSLPTTPPIRPKYLICLSLSLLKLVSRFSFSCRSRLLSTPAFLFVILFL